MIKLAIDSKLATILDRVVASYKFPGRLCGKAPWIPKLEEKDIPKTDVPHAENMLCYIIPSTHDKEIMEAAAGIWTNRKLIALSGRFHYPLKGFMSWHTNSNQEGWRLYATYCNKNEQSFFRYMENGKMHTEMEKSGWNFRGFEVRKGKPYWHCVWSDCDRYSFGFRFGS